MTIAGNYNPPQYTGNGTTTIFAIPFPFFAFTDIVPNLFDTNANAAVSPQPVLNGGATYDFTISGGSQDPQTLEYSGYSVVMNNPPLGNHRITVNRATAETQNTQLSDNAPFPAKALEAAYDRLTMICQELMASVQRAVLAPIGDALPINMTLAAAFRRANSYLGFDQNGNLTYNSPPTVSITAQPLGTRAVLLAASIAAPILFLSTTGYAAAGDGGEANYVRVNSQPAHPLYFQSADGAYWEIAAKSVAVEAAGAKGDNSTNDVVAFQSCFQWVQTKGGGRVTYGGHGQTYLIAYNSSNPALVMPSNTLFENIDGAGTLRVDPTALPNYPLAGVGPVSGVTGNKAIAAYGEICTGDAYLLSRAGNTGGVTDGFLAIVDPASFVSNVTVVRPRITSTYGGTLGSNQFCNGLSLWFTLNGRIIDGYFWNLPGNGVAFIGGNNNSFHGLTRAEGNGFTQTGFAKNGVSMTGFVVLNQQSLNSSSMFAHDISSNYNHDEGVQWANWKGIHINTIVATGNLDRMIEGDSAYQTSHVKGDTVSSHVLGEIPDEIVIGAIIGDGLYSDGVTYASRGITITCGNQVRVSIGSVRLRNVQTAPASASIMSVFCNNNGRVDIGSFTDESCAPGTNGAHVLIQAEYAYVSNVRIVTPVGTAQWGVQLINASVGVVDGVDADSGVTNVVVFSGSAAATRHEARHVVSRGTANSAVLQATSNSVATFSLTDCDFSGVNSGASGAEGVVAIGNSSFTCTNLIMRRNRARFAGRTKYPLMALGGVTVANNAVTHAYINDNDFFDSNLSQDFGTRSVISTAWFANLHDFDNNMTGQRKWHATAIPTTGFWAQGDTVINDNPTAAGTQLWRCTTRGSAGSVSGSPTATTDGTTNTVVFNASQLGVNLFLNDIIAIATVSGNFKIISITDATHAVVDSIPGSAVSNQAVTYSAPIFKAVALAA